MPLFDRVLCEVSFEIRMGTHRPADELESSIFQFRSETEAPKTSGHWLRPFEMTSCSSKVRSAYLVHERR